MSRALALALALAAPLALAQAPQDDKPGAQKAQKANAPQKAQKAQAPKPRGAQGASKAHAKPTPEQIRRFNQLEKQEQGGKR